MCDMHRHDCAVTIPDPPTQQRRRVVSLRFSDEELRVLEECRVRLAEYWNFDSVERSDVIRAALTMLLKELKEAKESK